MNHRTIGHNKLIIIKIIIIMVLIGYTVPCVNVNQGKSQRPRIIIQVYIPYSVFNNKKSHITRKRWNKLIKIKNGNSDTNNNQETNNKNDKNKKYYHKVVIWNKVLHVTTANLYLWLHCFG